MWEQHGIVGINNTVIKYRLIVNGKPLFDDTGYRPSPAICIDSTESFDVLMAMLCDDSLRQEHAYTRRQLEWFDSVECYEVMDSLAPF